MREINQLAECLLLNRFTDLLQDGETRHNGKLIGIGKHRIFFLSQRAYFRLFLLHHTLPLNHSQARILSG
jgi:hypothetical protein